MKNLQKGFISTTLLIIILLLALGGYYFYSKRNINKNIIEKIPTNFEQKNIKILSTTYGKFFASPDNISISKGEKVAISWSSLNTYKRNETTIMELTSINADSATLEIINFDSKTDSYILNKEKVVNARLVNSGYCCSPAPILNITLLSTDNQKATIEIKTSATGWDE